MKIIKGFLLSIVILIFSGTGILASDLIKENNGQKCFDLDAAYEEIYQTSKAVTGKDQSLDAVKRAETLASFTNIMGIIIGDRFFCINDPIAASNTSSFKNSGLLGFFENTSFTLLASLPQISVTEHLAQNFIPGYRENSTFANTAIAPPPTSITPPPTSITPPPTINNPQTQTTTQQGLSEQEAGGKADYWRGIFMNKTEEEIERLLDEQATDLLEPIDHIEEEESAQLSGYDYLKDSLRLDALWSVSRDLAYLFMVLVVIVVGFMIMFRKNLPGSVVVSLGNSLPKIIATVVLITFSFAIVGLVLDVARVGMNVTGAFFINAHARAGDEQAMIMKLDSVGKMTDRAIFYMKPYETHAKIIGKIPLIGPALENAFSSSYNNLETNEGRGSTVFLSLQTLILGGLSVVIRSIIDLDWNGVEILGNNVDILFTLAELIVDPVLSIVNVGLLAWIAVNLLILIVSLYASFRLFITILISYFKIFMSVVLGPIQIMTGAIPGNFSAVEKWLKSVFANTMVFVVIFFIINFFSYLAKFVDPSEFTFFGNRGVLWPNWIVPIKGIFIIAGYLFAANAPSLVSGMLNVGPNKTMAATGESVKKAASKIPFVGGLFN